MTSLHYTPGTALPQHTLIAHNDAAASANKIHDDTVAQQYGFRGGLVPGVSVYAYMTYPLVQSFGIDWLTRGKAQVRFSKPIYEGDRVTVGATVTTAADDQIDLDISGSNAEGLACGLGTAQLPAAEQCPPESTCVPAGAESAAPVPVSWDAVVVGQPLSVRRLQISQTENEEYCRLHADDLTIYRGPQGLVHPGILLRQCNRALSEHFILGPWIHVGSEITTYRPCQIGASLEIRAVPIDKFEKKGHAFTVLDVLLLVEGAVAQRVQHTCIFRPRQSRRADN
ncbi:MAG: hypothetical protein AB7N91_01490 [Candidatus Tectimicrobiota bacterium]